jgi:6-phosphofructokinase 1
MLTKSECEIESLGAAEFPSPLLQRLDETGEAGIRFRDGSQRILVEDRVDRLAEAGLALDEAPAFELAGPRRKLFFDPARTTIGIVTCGGLCPGLNNVIRDVVMAATHHYGVGRIVGFRYGYRGLVTEGLQLDLTPDLVSEIHERGGTILGSSRGAQAPEDMVDGLVRHGIDVLFVVGGDGTMRGADALCGEIKRRGLRIGVIGVPKTIDNDFKWMDQSFGFVTAASKGLAALNGAHREAQGAPNGVGVVKLMGRHSGWIATYATHASGNVNVCLIPEVPLDIVEVCQRV